MRSVPMLPEWRGEASCPRARVVPSCASGHAATRLCRWCAAHRTIVRAVVSALCAAARPPSRKARGSGNSPEKS